MQGGTSGAGGASGAGGKKKTKSDQEQKAEFQRLKNSEGDFMKRKQAASKCVEDNYKFGELYNEFLARVDSKNLSLDLLKRLWKDRNEVEKKKIKEEDAISNDPDLADEDLDKEMAHIIAN